MELSLTSAILLQFHHGLRVSFLGTFELLIWSGGWINRGKGKGKGKVVPVLN
jgi:hypothetical protein